MNLSALTWCSPLSTASTTTSLSGNLVISLVPSSYLIRTLEPSFPTAETLPPYHFFFLITFPSFLILVANRTLTRIPEATCLRLFFSDMLRAHSTTSAVGGVTVFGLEDWSFPFSDLSLFFFFFCFSASSPVGSGGVAFPASED